MNIVIDETIAPKELIVGKKDNKCFITFIKNGKLNSEWSWKNWSENSDNPIIVKNEFMSGFKFSGLNKRYSRNAKNKDVLTITHPSFNLDFEIKTSHLNSLMKSITIKNGEILEELIIDNNRELLTKEMYIKNLSEKQKLDKEKEDKRKKLSSSVMKAKDLIPGKLYRDTRNGYYTCYLGTLEKDNKKLFSYIIFFNKPTSIRLRTKTKEPNEYIFHSRLLSYITSNNPYPAHIETVKTRRKMSSCEEEFNIFDGLDEVEWVVIKETYLKQSLNVNWKEEFEEKIKELSSV